MTEHRNEKEQRAVAYLQRLLQRNPLYESERIIRSRATALGLKKTKQTSDAEEIANQREIIRKQIDAVRADCWTKPVDTLLKKIQQLPLDKHPNLQRAAERLLVILRHRDQLPGLTSHKHFDEKFLSCFKKILTLPPREQAIPREQVIASFRNRKLGRRGRKMIALLEQQVPELCQLEQVWLDSLKRQKVAGDKVVKADGYDSMAEESSGISSWVVGILFFVGVKIAIAIFRNS